MAKPKLTAEIGTRPPGVYGHDPAATVTNVENVRIQVPQLDWLEWVDIEFDRDGGALTIRVRPMDENHNAPDLRVLADGSFTVRS